MWYRIIQLVTKHLTFVNLMWTYPSQKKTYNCNIIKNLLTRRRIHRPNNQVSQRPRRVIVKWPVLTFWKEDGGGYIGGGDDDVDILKAGWIKLHWWWWCTENWNDMMMRKWKTGLGERRGLQLIYISKRGGCGGKRVRRVCMQGWRCNSLSAGTVGDSVTLSVTVDHR